MRLIVGFFVLNWPRVDMITDVKRPKRLSGEAREKAQGGRGELEVWRLVAGGMADVATSLVVVVPAVARATPRHWIARVAIFSILHVKELSGVGMLLQACRRSA
jgi:hypothetical protein